MQLAAVLPILKTVSIREKHLIPPHRRTRSNPVFLIERQTEEATGKRREAREGRRQP
jgi:hypothetical protein